jgi:ribosomal protein S17E
MENHIKNRLEQIYWSIYLYNTSLSELQILNEDIYTEDEIKIVNSHTLKFYGVTLQYCFIMEYCKLLEIGKKNNYEHISSLNRLNEILLNDYTKDFKDSYEVNLSLIENIKSSNFYLKIKNLRDKKFGHADKDEINTPFCIKGFRKEDFENGFNHLKMIGEIFTSFDKIIGRNHSLEIPSEENRTRNFIKFHAKYQTHYMKNYLANQTEELNKKSNGS